MKLKIEISAGGIVFKKEKDQVKWLIIQHSFHKGWVFPKGLIGDAKENEPKEEAALREVKEEGGVQAKIINPEPIKINYAYRFKEFLVKKTVYYYLMEYVAGDPKDHDWEATDAKFMTEDEIRKTLTYKSDRQAFEKITNAFQSLSLSRKDK
jgi:8-oxo-dGTP pyrophosphatase MutT (NUDIX family)